MIDITELELCNKNDYLNTDNYHDDNIPKIQHSHIATLAINITAVSITFCVACMVCKQCHNYINIK